MIKDNIIKDARSYLGVPWVHQGRSIRGVDCVGFIILAMEKNGINIEDIIGYSSKPDGVTLKNGLDTQNCFKEVTTIEPGDVILFRIRHDPQHVALAVPSNTAKIGIIHSYNGGERKVIEHDLADYWKSKIVAIYRLK